MVLKLHKLDPSPPARAAMMIFDYIKVPFEFVDTDLFKGEHRSPEFLKKNPTHTVPLLEDGDLIIHDSHAILQYLADAYVKDDILYPKDIKKRALVNQKLFFDAVILFGRLRNVTYPAVIEGNPKVEGKKLEAIKEAYEILESFLSQTKWLAGDNMTIADISAVASLSTLNDIVKIDSSKYPKTVEWFNKMKEQTFYKKYNLPGQATLGALLKKTLQF